MIKSIVNLVGNHQLFTVISIMAVALMGWRSLSHYKKVFGDEDYTSKDWVLSLVAPIVSAVIVVVFTIILLVTLTT